MIAFAIFSFCLLVGVRNAWLTWRSIGWIEAGNRDVPRPPASTIRFIILIPLLREQTVIRKLLRRMAALDCGAAADVRFVFVTTSREGHGPGSTAAFLEQALFETGRPDFLHVHCATGTDTSKADQLNFALARIGLLGGRAADTFIGVYDADSSPDPRTLTYVVAHACREPDLKAIQQVPLYVQNLRGVAGLRDLYLTTRPFHNALFALTVEVPGMRRQPAAFSSPAGSLRRTCGGWLSHGLGHGQFFRLDALTEFGGFRPPSCDTQFGHALALCGVPIHAHPMLDVGETPDSIGVLIRQGVVWFNSMNTIWRTRRFVATSHTQAYAPLAAAVMIGRSLHASLAWAFYPIVFLGAMLWCIAAGRWSLAAYGALAWAVYLVPVAMIVARYDLWAGLCARFEPIRTPSIPTRIGIVLMFGVEKLGGCISPLLWCAYAVRSWFDQAPIALHKTERAGS